MVQTFDFVEEFVLPSVKLDALNILEGLVDVSHTLVMLLALFLVNLTFIAASDVAHQELSECEQDYDEAVPSNVLEGEIRRYDELEWAFNVVGHRPDKCPDTPRFTHDYGAYFTLCEVFVGCIAHP